MKCLHLLVVRAQGIPASRGSSCPESLRALVASVISSRQSRWLRFRNGMRVIAGIPYRSLVPCRQHSSDPGRTRRNHSAKGYHAEKSASFDPRTASHATSRIPSRSSRRPTTIETTSRKVPETACLRLLTGGNTSCRAEMRCKVVMRPYSTTWL
jgi:hypothetical protein